MTIKLGSLIKEAITMNNLTQKEAAKKLNISPQSLSMYVNDHRTPDLQCFIAMINTFHINFDLLVKMGDVLSLSSKDILLYFAINELSNSEKEKLFIMITILKKMRR